jgi:pilus assembly protein Flp/PilA
VRLKARRKARAGQTVLLYQRIEIANRRIRRQTKNRKVVIAMLFAPKEKGQGLVEYALILVLVAVVVIVILALLGPAIGNVFSNIVSNI